MEKKPVVILVDETVAMRRLIGGDEVGALEIFRAGIDHAVAQGARQPSSLAELATIGPGLGLAVAAMPKDSQVLAEWLIRFVLETVPESRAVLGMFKDGIQSLEVFAKIGAHGCPACSCGLEHSPFHDLVNLTFGIGACTALQGQDPHVYMTAFAVLNIKIVQLLGHCLPSMDPDTVTRGTAEAAKLIGKERLIREGVRIQKYLAPLEEKRQESNRELN